MIVCTECRSILSEHELQDHMEETGHTTFDMGDGNLPVELTPMTEE